MPLRAAMLLGLFTLSTALNAQSNQPALSDVLDRLSAYLKSYAERLPATVARERYIQKAAGYQRVELESDFGIVRLPGYPQWLGFRDVLRVNNRPVSDRELRLAELFFNPPSNVYQHAVRIAEASARFNIGPHRTINNPAIALELLRQRDRLRCFLESERTADRNGVLAIQFEEIGRPTIVQTLTGGDAPATGRAWVDINTGVLRRVDLVVTLPRSPADGRLGRQHVTVTFEHQPRLGFWVPARLTEELIDETNIALTGEAIYSDYRRFEIDTREEIAPPH